MPISKILELYARSGRSLISKGFNEAALPLADAHVALELFNEQRWRVLGGDVYRMTKDGEFELTYEDWFYDGESVAQSVGLAYEVVNRLAGQPVYIVFVVDAS
jgi:hypothetical protein